MVISVIVPTYCRVKDLQRCLEALANQSRQADEIIVTVRDTDAHTLDFLHNQSDQRDHLNQRRIVIVTEPGVVAAMNAGLHAARGAVIALTDDDAAPWPDWLSRIEAHFASDPQIAGVGGRDWVYQQGKLDDGNSTNVGQMSWFGRVSAGHHHVVGEPRDVVVLKGVNCAYRAEPLRAVGFDSRLAGTGAQVSWELSLGLALQRAGWRLVLDPALGVDHFPAPRFDEDQRARFSGLAERNAVANETLVLFEHLRGMQRIAFVFWAILVGTRQAPGFAQVIRLLLTHDRNVLERYWATLRGRWAGIGMYRQGKR